LTQKLLSHYKQKIRSLKLVPASGGCFEITVNGDLIYSKLKTGKFPDEQWVLDTLATKAQAKAS
jgi:selenoprotein W-related protein